MFSLAKRPGASIVIKTSEVRGYKLVWADEFNKAGRPDAANWNYEQGFVRNNERQWYQPENAWCEKEFLILEGRKERKPNLTYEAGSSKAGGREYRGIVTKQFTYVRDLKGAWLLFDNVKDPFQLNNSPYAFKLLNYSIILFRCGKHSRFIY